MKTLITIASIALTACGGRPPDTVNTKTYGCDSQIVAVMATMTTPNVLGLGAPDTTTYTTSGQNHVLIYEFKLARQTITFEYNTNYCGETVIK
jgi:hypothetical protein